MTPEIRPLRTLWLLAIAHAVNHAQAVLLPLVYLKVIEEFVSASARSPCSWRLAAGRRESSSWVTHR